MTSVEIATLTAVITAIVAVLGLGATFVIHIIKYAYKQGVTDQRIAALEKSVAEVAGVKELLAGIQSTVEALTRAVDRLDRATERLSEPPSRGSRGSSPLSNGG